VVEIEQWNKKEKLERELGLFVGLEEETSPKIHEP
jgi:hypothetical protein